MTLRFDQFTYLQIENDDIQSLSGDEPFSHRVDNFDEVEMYNPVRKGKRIITKYEDFQSYLLDVGNPTAE